MTPKLSVVIITYNHEKYIAQCINSLLAQSFHEFELIIVDDGSADRTREIIQQFDDPRIIYHYQENMGPSAASNVGISLASTEYISYMSGDDMAYESRLENQYNYFLTHPESAIIFGKIEVIDEEGRVVPSHHVLDFFESVVFSDRYDLFNRFFFHGNCLNAVTCMFRRSYFEKTQGFQLASLQTQDYMMWFGWIKHSELTLLDTKFAYYRVRDNNQNLSSSENDDRTIFECEVILERILDDLDIDYFKKAFSREIRLPNFSSAEAFELEKAFIYLKHDRVRVKAIGLKKLFYLLQNNGICAAYLKEYHMSFKEYYALSKKISFDSHAMLEEKHASLQLACNSLQHEHDALHHEVARFLPIIIKFHKLKATFKKLLLNLRKGVL